MAKFNWQQHRMHIPHDDPRPKREIVVTAIDFGAASDSLTGNYRTFSDGGTMTWTNTDTAAAGDSVTYTYTIPANNFTISDAGTYTISCTAST